MFNAEPYCFRKIMKKVKNTEKSVEEFERRYEVVYLYAINYETVTTISISYNKDTVMRVTH